MKEDLLRDLKKAVKASEQTGIFDSASAEEKVMESCVRYLRSKGYTVVGPKKFKRKMNSTDDIIHYFYLLLNVKHPEGYATSYNANKDRSVAKKFIESRMEVTGAGKEYALNECGEIISTIFEHYDEFNFSYAINFSIFGQDKLKWVTDKALQIMNRRMKEKEEEEGEILRQKAIKAHEHEQAGFSDLADLVKQMEEEEDA